MPAHQLPRDTDPRSNPQSYSARVILRPKSSRCEKPVEVAPPGVMAAASFVMMAPGRFDRSFGPRFGCARGGPRG